jgi:hypothetical protein
MAGKTGPLKNGLNLGHKIDTTNGSRRGVGGQRTFRLISPTVAGKSDQKKGDDSE